eukprot:gene14182-47883_t
MLFSPIPYLGGADIELEADELAEIAPQPRVYRRRLRPREARDAAASAGPLGEVEIELRTAWPEKAVPHLSLPPLSCEQGRILLYIETECVESGFGCEVTVMGAMELQCGAKKMQVYCEVTPSGAVGLGGARDGKPRRTRTMPGMVALDAPNRGGRKTLFDFEDRLTWDLTEGGGDATFQFTLLDHQGGDEADVPVGTHAMGKLGQATRMKALKVSHGKLYVALRCAAAPCDE